VLALMALTTKVGELESKLLDVALTNLESKLLDVALADLESNASLEQPLVSTARLGL
jgi:hypothetical protein